MDRRDVFMIFKINFRCLLQSTAIESMQGVTAFNLKLMIENDRDN